MSTAEQRFRAALELIGTECENFWRGTCVDNGRTPDARYLADRWCDKCIARVALDGDEIGGLAS